MTEVAAATVDLVVTSPPYWHLKDYGGPGQIGYGQSLHEYLQDLYLVWRECRRVLRPGGRLCINVGDQFARAAVYGRYKIIPLHAEIIGQGEHLGFDFLGSIIWQKKTTMNTTGGAPVMGSYPFPPNGLVEIDYEFILIFKKPGAPKKVSREVKEASRLSREEWKEYFSGHWRFGGARQVGHEAMFPEELPRRLIRMFSFVGDTVLDPFVGSGTTVKAALDLGRNAWGYEINEKCLPVMKEKVGFLPGLLFPEKMQIIKQTPPEKFETSKYRPRIQNAKPQPKTLEVEYKPNDLVKVTKIIDESTIMTEDGRSISFLGVKIDKKEETLRYLHDSLLGKKIRLRYSKSAESINGKSFAYVFLKNKININSFLIKANLASPDNEIEHKYKSKFNQLMKKE